MSDVIYNSFIYDKDNRVIRIDGDDLTTHCVYSNKAMINKKTTKNENEVIMLLDDNGKIIKEISKNKFFKYKYNKDGSISEKFNDLFVVKYIYDNKKNLIEKTLNGNKFMEYYYNDSNQLIFVKDYLEGKITRRTYNSEGLIDYLIELNDIKNINIRHISVYKEFDKLKFNEPNVIKKTFLYDEKDRLILELKFLNENMISETRNSHNVSTN